MVLNREPVIFFTWDVGSYINLRRENDNLIKVGQGCQIFKLGYYRHCCGAIHKTDFDCAFYNY